MIINSIITEWKNDMRDIRFLLIPLRFVQIKFCVFFVSLIIYFAFPECCENFIISNYFIDNHKKMKINCYLFFKLAFIS